MSIRLSEKHGVNPMLASCFLCGEDTGEIALLGKMKGDAAAPHRGVITKEPWNVWAKDSELVPPAEQKKLGWVLDEILTGPGRDK